MKRTINKLIVKLMARYVIITEVSAKQVVHYARDWDDMLSWLECYPEYDSLVVYESFLGRMAVNPVAARGCH